jgi:acid phosphatase (class A)
MRKLSIMLAALMLGGMMGHAQQVYFTTEELPDLIKALPAPPDSLSQGFTYDIMRYLWGKTQREDAARA